MKKLAMLAGALSVLAVPGAVQAQTPTGQDKTNAARECRTERGTTDATREAFKARYGTNKNKSNAFGKCVSKRAHDEAAERKAARSNASKQCDAERGETAESRAAFEAKYGTGKTKSNAFGKCVSQKASENEAKSDAADAAAAQARKNAARTCDEERGETAESRAAFKAKYGTNRNKSNAFGKCVSKTAKAQQS